MMACVAPAAHTRSEQSGSTVAGGGLAPPSEWQSYSGGFRNTDLINRTEGVVLGHVPSLAILKPERQLYREPEDEGGQYDYYLQARKRAKLQESMACPVSVPQSSGHPCGTPFTSAGLAHGMGGGSGLPSRYPALSVPMPASMPMLRRSNPMLPPMAMAVPEGPCNPLGEPSPLGLTLRKTPSLLDLITFQLQNSAGAGGADSENSAQGVGKARIGKCLAPTGSASQDKLKASNFPASTLKIGTWERSSRYEGDLVAKCYYAKRKLVWEVLDSGLKSKVEIQWSDISAMKASCPDNLPGSLEIEVSRPPLFFKETNPQPRKHTLWQATTDFTGGQASRCKVHYLQFPEGVLNRHYEKLVQCDPRLKALVEGTLSGSVPRDEGGDGGVECEAAGQAHGKGWNGVAHVYEGSNERPHSPLSPLSPYSYMQGRGGCPGVGAEMESESMRRSEQASPSSVMELRRCEEGGDSDSGSGSGSGEYCMREDLGSYSPYAVDSGYAPGAVTSIGYELRETKAATSSYSGGGGVSASNRQILDEIAQLLLGDSSVSLSNEQAILLATRMGSMQAALGREFSSGVGAASQAGLEGFPVMEGGGGYYGANNGGRSMPMGAGGDGQGGNNFDTNSRLPKKSCTNMSESSLKSVVECLPKNYSTGDLLMNLPRVASLPQLFESVSQVPASRYTGIQ